MISTTRKDMSLAVKLTILCAGALVIVFGLLTALGR
jgi:hypothetical protein